MRVLLVEDNHVFKRAIEALLKHKAPFPVDLEHVDSLATALDRLRIGGPDLDIILLDLSLPDSTGLHTLEQIRKKSFGLPVVVLTGKDDERFGVEAVKAGAQDYLLKGALDGGIIVRAMQYAVERAKFLTEREDFVATLSHDLKNPLIGCDKLLGLLIDEVVDISEHRTLFQHIKTSNRAVLSMIDNLLEIYKYDRPLTALALENTNLVRLASACIDEWRPIADIRGIDLLGIKGDESVSIMADSSSIRRVLQNLLDNAIKYSTTGSVISVTVSADQENATLEVVNQGQPLSDHDLKHLFNRFWRGETTRTREVGTGLGLYLCRQLIELHHGTINCRNSDDGGSTVFSIELPRNLTSA